MSSRQCYYPNGDLSKSDPPDIPCNDDDGAPCCPDKWECQSNGLCYYQPDDYYGRYTCTDQSWESDGCPRICTYGTLNVYLVLGKEKQQEYSLMR